MKFRDSVRFCIVIENSHYVNSKEIFCLWTSDIGQFTQTIENDLIERVSLGKPVGADLSLSLDLLASIWYLVSILPPQDLILFAVVQIKTII